jgi:hypothetical protein
MNQIECYDVYSEYFDKRFDPGLRMSYLRPVDDKEDSFYLVDDEDPPMELYGTIDTMDLARRDEILEVVNTCLAMEIGERDICPYYTRQQVLVSEIPLHMLKVYGVVDIVFPPVGAEYLTKRKLDGIVWNAEGCYATTRIESLAYGVKEYVDTMEEGIAFKIVLEDEDRHFLWFNNQISRIVSSVLAEVRGDDDIKLDYTNEESHEELITVPMSYTYFDHGRSYYVYLEGIPYYVGKDRTAVMEVSCGVSKSKEGTAYYPIDAPDGVYIIDLDRRVVVKETRRKLDSDQQIQIILTSSVTTDMIIEKYPKLHRARVINHGPHVMDIVSAVDTRYNTCQIIKESFKEPNNRKQLMLRLSKGGTLMSTSYKMASHRVVVGNSLYSGFRGYQSSVTGIFNSQIYTRQRTSGSILVVRNTRSHALRGTWYAQRNRTRLKVNEQPDDDQNRDH